MENPELIKVQAKANHLVLRPVIFVRLFIGVLGCIGLGIAVAALTSAMPLSVDWAVAAIVAIASTAFGLAYATTEVHATPTRLCLRRFWLTVWSVPMERAGTTEGKGPDWHLVFVFDLKTQKRVGAINWWILDPRERVRLAEFVDHSRAVLGVKF